MAARRRFRGEAAPPTMAVKWRVVKAVGTGLSFFAGGLLLLLVWPSDEVRSAKLSKDFRGSSQSYSDSQRQNALMMEIQGAPGSPSDFYRERAPLGFRPSGRAASGAEAALLLGGNMAAQPGGGGAVAPRKSFFWSCFSCRVVAGGGLAGAGLWVYLGVRQSLRQKRPGHPYDIFRLALAMGLYAGAIVTIFDPVQPK